MTSRLIAQMKADSSRAIAVATTVRRLPFRTSDRKRPHSPFALSTQSRARASVRPPPLAVLSAHARRISIAPGRLHKDASRPAITGLGDAAALDLVTVELSEGTRPK